MFKLNIGMPCMKSLAQYVNEKRETLGLSVIGLAHRANIPLDVLCDIESGKELFLATTVRQKLAKGLKVSPSEIKKYEKIIDFKLEAQEDTTNYLKQEILNGAKELKCPKCGSLLKCRIAKLYDLEDNLVLHPKAVCTNCPFQITH